VAQPATVAAQIAPTTSVAITTSSTSSTSTTVKRRRKPSSNVGVDNSADFVVSPPEEPPLPGDSGTESVTDIAADIAPAPPATSVKKFILTMGGGIGGLCLLLLLVIAKDRLQ
jgi:hypothetical protein